VLAAYGAHGVPKAVGMQGACAAREIAVTRALVLLRSFSTSPPP